MFPFFIFRKELVRIQMLEGKIFNKVMNMGGDSIASKTHKRQRRKRQSVTAKREKVTNAKVCIG